MNTFNNVPKEAMVKYMDAFVELAKLMPEIEKTDIDTIQTLSTYIKDDCDLAPEVADGYRAVYDRVYDMIFTGSTKQTPYTSPIKGVYKHRVDYREYGSPISRRDEKLHQLLFDTYETAEKFCNTLIDYISKYGSITVEDTINEYDTIYDDNDYTATFSDSRYGWTNLPSKTDDMIVRDGCSWRVVLPKPAEL